MATNKNNDVIIRQDMDPFVYFCDDIVQLKHQFMTTTFKDLPTLDISENNEILTSNIYSRVVQIYTENKF